MYTTSSRTTRSEASTSSTPIWRARNACSKYAEFIGPGVHTTTVASPSAAGATERSAASRGCGEWSTARPREGWKEVGGAHEVVVEEPRDEPRHRDAVLEHVGDAARGPHVVLEHLPRAVGVADQVAAGDGEVAAARRPDAVDDAGEVRAGDDQPPRHDPLAHDVALVVDVVDEAVQRPDALREAALDVRPLPGRQDPGDEVERERP